MVVSWACWEWLSQGLDSCHIWFRENICRIWHRGKKVFHEKCHFQPLWCGTGEISHPLLDSFLDDAFRVEKYCRSAQGAGSRNVSSASVSRYTGWISSTFSCQVYLGVEVLCSTGRGCASRGIAKCFSALSPVLVPSLTVWGEKTYCLWPVSDRCRVPSEGFSVIPAVVAQAESKVVLKLS